MIPFQTFLALIAVLLMVSSCSQTEPPHPDGSNQTSTSATTEGQLESNHTATSGNLSSATWVQMTDKIAHFNLLGDDAKTLYSLMPIEAEQAGGESAEKIKEGVQFNCFDESTGYSCGFTIDLSTGTLPIFLQPNEVKEDPTFINPLAALTAPYINGSIAELPLTQAQGRVRLFVYTGQASLIYEALKIPEVPGSGDVGTIVTEKNSDDLACTKTKTEKTGESIYFCDIYLNASTGAVDKPSDDSSLYPNARTH
jgi:hypothetical protein